jgi:putative ABC transport system permease protein
MLQAPPQRCLFETESSAPSPKSNLLKIFLDVARPLFSYPWTRVTPHETYGCKPWHAKHLFRHPGGGAGRAMIDLAWKMLRDDKSRFVTTVTGVGFAVSLVYVQVGIFLGMLDNASITIERMDAELWVTARNTPNIDFANTFPSSYVQRVRSVPGVARADNLIVWFVSVALPTGAKESALVYAMENFPKWGYPWSVVSGDLANLRRGRFAFLDDSAERRFGAFRDGDYREFLGHRLKIIGRTRGARSFTTNPVAFVDYRQAQEMAPRELRGRTTYIVVKLRHGANLESVRAEIRRRLPYNDVRTRDEWAGRSRRYWIDNTGLGLSMYVTVFLGALVGVVVVGQTLYTATMENYRVYATIKALGGSNAAICLVIAEQAVIAAVFGSVVGLGLAHAVRPVMDRLDLRMIFPDELATTIFSGTVVLCLAASVLSFRRIAALDPATVLRD